LNRALTLLVTGVVTIVLLVPVVSVRPTAAHAVLTPHVHEGVCGDFSQSEPRPLDELGYVTPLLDPEAATPVGPFKSAGPEGAFPTMLGLTTIEASLDELLATPHAIDVHITDEGENTDALTAAEPETVDIVLTCGNIGGVRNGDDLVFGLQSAPDAGTDTMGIAWLHANADDTTTVRLFVSQGLAEGGYGAVPTPSSDS
jgi:hypothetical protein